MSLGKAVQKPDFFNLKWSSSLPFPRRVLGKAVVGRVLEKKEMSSCSAV